MIVVIGGNSRLGRAIVRQLGDHALPIARKRRDNSRTLIVDSYHDVSAAMLSGASAIINCAGLVTGSKDDLDRANRALPLHLAHEARLSGVLRFVHISSFSVYGDAECIEAFTPEIPTTDYGRSKLAGDHALAALTDPDFYPVSLRIPLLVDAMSDNKLMQLVRLSLRTGFLPVAVRPTCRAMLSYEAAAATAIALTGNQTTGVILAADRIPFTYELLGERIFTATGRRLRLLRLPAMLTNAVKLVRPGIYASMFRSCRLPDEANFARGIETVASLPTVITEMIEKAVRSSR